MSYQNYDGSKANITYVNEDVIDNLPKYQVEKEGSTAQMYRYDQKHLLKWYDIEEEVALDLLGYPSDTFLAPSKIFVNINGKIRGAIIKEAVGISLFDEKFQEITFQDLDHAHQQFDQELTKLSNLHVFANDLKKEHFVFDPNSKKFQQFDLDYFVKFAERSDTVIDPIKRNRALYSEFFESLIPNEMITYIQQDPQLFSLLLLAEMGEIPYSQFFHTFVETIDDKSLSPHTFHKIHHK